MKTNVAALKRLGAFFLICLAIFFIPVLHAQVQCPQALLDYRRHSPRPTRAR